MTARLRLLAWNYNEYLCVAQLQAEGAKLPDEREPPSAFKREGVENAIHSLQQALGVLQEFECELQPAAAGDDA